MGAGKMRDVLRFERKASGKDRFGNPVDGWALFLRVRGDVLETLGKERLAAGRLEANATATVRVRGSAKARQLGAADRVFMRGAHWNIKGSAPVGRDGAQIEFVCEKGGAV